MGRDRRRGGVAQPTADAGDATPDDLSQWVAGRLAHYKRPRHVVVVDEVRRTTVGKVDYEWARTTLA